MLPPQRIPEQRGPMVTSSKLPEWACWVRTSDEAIMEVQEWLETWYDSEIIGIFTFMVKKELLQRCRQKYL
jgi:hypothetical protein